MEQITAERVAREIVSVIFKDLSDRRGIRQALEEIDRDIHFEIIKTLETAVVEVLCDELG